MALVATLSTVGFALWNGGFRDASPRKPTGVKPGFAVPVEPDRPWFGVLESTGDRQDEERKAGLRVVSLHIAWDRYEPIEGHFDLAYVSRQRSMLARILKAGFAVTLEPGLQYPPQWVFNLDAGSRFRDQHGKSWSALQASGDNVANSVFDSRVRNAQATYIRQVAADLGDGFFAVRVGGLSAGEMKFPGSEGPPDLNSYWAFDPSANARKPSAIAAWTPGQASDHGESLAFYNFYIDSLCDYERWLLTSFGSAFPNARLELLLGGFGIRPGWLEPALRDALSGRTGPQSTGELRLGNDWQRLAAAVPQPNRTILYTTFLDDGHNGDTVLDQPAVAFLASIAASHGMAVAGENSHATDTLRDLNLCFVQVRRFSLVGMMWLDEKSLFDGSTPTISDFSRLVHGLRLEDRRTRRLYNAQKGQNRG